MGRPKVSIFVESRYKLSRKRVTHAIEDMLAHKAIDKDVEVSVAIVGDRKMRSLNKKYRNLDKTTNILSFPLGEGKAMPSEQNILRLGDIVISYPQVIKEATEEEMMVDDKISDLVQHGLLHLLGLHHE